MCSCTVYKAETGFEITKTNIFINWRIIIIIII